MKIVVQRSGALGDVIMTTPIIRRLRRENPDAEIGVLTAHPYVFHMSPHLSVQPADPNKAPDRHINLDLAYEKRQPKHVIQSYMQEAFGDDGDPDDLHTELFYKPMKLFKSNQRFVAVHAAKAGWSNRTLPTKTWKDVITQLRKHDLTPIMVGTSRDDIDGFNCIRMMNTSPQQQASLISQCVAFVGSCSAVLHIAGTTDTPIVGVYTCTRPETYMPWRHGQLGWKVTPVIPDLPCVGCLAERQPPVTTEWCHRGDNACVDAVDPTAIVSAVLQVLK